VAIPTGKYAFFAMVITFEASVTFAGDVGIVKVTLETYPTPGRTAIKATILLGLIVCS
jgi:hypothetical protein